MIASVRGMVLSAGLDSAVIDVGGVGLLLHTTAGTAASLRPGAEAVLATTLVVREESLTLFGFADEDERAVFTLVQTVSVREVADGSSAKATRPVGETATRMRGAEMSVTCRQVRPSPEVHTKPLAAPLVVP